MSSLPTYLIVDLSNLFFRGRHVARGDIDLKLGMSLNIVFGSIKKSWDDFNATHVVFCLEGRSWRKDFYPPYKANRAVAKAKMTPLEQEEDKLYWEALGQFIEFISEKTNCTVLQHSKLEADDLIAGFIQLHPAANHVILSTDTDFYQLLAPNVKQYNGISEETHTINGILDKKGKFVIDLKTNLPKTIPDPEWILFEKCIRGDSTDNVFSAYPGVRVKGSKNKTGLLEAFTDKTSKGYAWNNLMLHRWVDHNNVEHRVLDDFERNRILIDLSAQPPEVRQFINETITTATSTPKEVSQVGIRLLKFCNSFDMKRIVDQIHSYAPAYQATYLTVK